jgi:tellurite resistance protein TerC
VQICTLVDSIGTPALWAGFTALVLALLALDLGVFHRRPHSVGFREATLWSAAWIGLAALFGAGVWAWAGSERGLEFATGYLVEKALSVDNLFVIALLFRGLAVKAEHQHRVLFWGILGALVMRLGFILGGGALLARFHWMIYLFGGLLLLTGLKLLVQKEKPPEPDKGLAVRALRRFLPVAPADGARFTVRAGGRLHATPLLLALVAIEATDLVFAVDSVPAVLAISQDAFIVFTSNVFAILGLRSLYFLLGGLLDKFHYLKVGLSAILAFVGAKMLLVGTFHIPVLASLAVIAGILLISILASLIRAHRRPLPA